MKRIPNSPRTGASFVAMLISLACSAAALAQSFPTTGGVIDANVIRRFTYGGTFLPSVTGFATGGASVDPSNNASYSIDGGGSLIQWDGVNTGSGSSGGIDITLDRAYDLAQFDLSNYFGGTATGGYTIEVSTTGFSSMTPVVTSPTGPGASFITDTLGTPTLGKYIRYTWNSPAPFGYVQLSEFRAYASTADASFVTPDGGYDIVALDSVSGPNTGPVKITDLTPGNWFSSDSLSNVIDLNQNTYLRGAGTGDAAFKLDLGDAHVLQAISLGFYPGQSWADATIEFSLDGTSWSNLINVSPAGPSTNIAVPGIYARYLRVTDIGGSTGALTDIQVFAVPEPASLGLIAVSSLILLARRRRA